MLYLHASMHAQLLLKVDDCFYVMHFLYYSEKGSRLRFVDLWHRVVTLE